VAAWALTVGHWKKVPIRVHASTPLGLLLFSGFQFAPVLWACLLSLVLVHELGHALVVKSVGATATEIMLTGFGGHCAWVGDVSPLGRAAIASGGVAAQLVLLVVALAAWQLDAVPDTAVAHDALYALTVSNGRLIALNLIPLAPLDGAQAWAFPFLLGKLVRSKLTRWRGARAAEHVVDDTLHQQAKAVARSILEDAKRDDDP
jgi:stage IV sporulation protein FB